jgi:hypothetical protein
MYIVQQVGEWSFPLDYWFGSGPFTPLRWPTQPLLIHMLAASPAQHLEGEHVFSYAQKRMVYSQHLCSELVCEGGSSVLLHLEPSVTQVAPKEARTMSRTLVGWQMRLGMYHSPHANLLDIQKGPPAHRLPGAWNLRMESQREDQDNHWKNLSQAQCQSESLKVVNW